MFKIISAALFVLLALPSLSQGNYQFSLNKVDEACNPGAAELLIHGTERGDAVSIAWSNGEKNKSTVHDLSEGAFSVEVIIQHTYDSIVITTDTTLYFSIIRELCPVGVDKYFSPNGDEYHDKLGINYIYKHPNFELNIFNKWGQKIHTQKKQYEPWDGTWNGIELPDGTYYYVFFYDASDKNKVEKGDITILR